METERYNRQVILQGFGTTAQQMLSKAKVLVVGAGGLGCPALQYLAAAGIGKIGIIDHDRVELSNLHRQVLYATQDIGGLKAKIAAQRIGAMNPSISINAYPYLLQGNNIIQLFKAYDYILDGTDNFEARYLINDACMLLNKPLVFAAVSGYEGQLAIFCVADENNQRANYRDLFPIPPSRGEIPNCAENGILGVLPGIIGTMQAAEVIKLITGIGRPMINKLMTYNLLDHKGYEIQINTAAVRSYHLPSSESEYLQIHQHSEETIIEINELMLENLMQTGQSLIIDVRENGETPLLNSQQFLQIPMSTVAQLMEMDIAQDHIVLICQHGVRSIAAAEYLKEKYTNTKKIYSLKGGIARYTKFFSNLKK